MILVLFKTTQKEKRDIDCNKDGNLILILE